MSLIYLFSPLFDGIKKEWKDNLTYIGNPDNDCMIIVNYREGRAELVIHDNMRFKFENVRVGTNDIMFFTRGGGELLFKTSYLLGMLR